MNYAKINVRKFLVNEDLEIKSLLEKKTLFDTIFSDILGQSYC